MYTWGSRCGSKLLVSDDIPGFPTPRWSSQSITRQRQGKASARTFPTSLILKPPLHLLSPDSLQLVRLSVSLPFTVLLHPLKSLLVSSVPFLLALYLSSFVQDHRAIYKPSTISSYEFKKLSESWQSRLLTMEFIYHH